MRDCAGSGEHEVEAQTQQEVGIETSWEFQRACGAGVELQCEADARNVKLTRGYARFLPNRLIRLTIYFSQSIRNV